ERTKVAELTRGHATVALVLKEVEIPPGVTGTFEIHAIRGEQKLLLGRFGIVGEKGNREKDKARRMTLLLDASSAVPSLIARKQPATLHLRGVTRGAKQFKLVAESAELRITRPAHKDR